jgi:hypothetical protein
MHTWKVLVILFLACLSIGLGMATIAIPISQDGNMKWVWGGSLLAGTLASGAMLIYFMRYASADLDIKPRGGRN